MKKLAKLLVIVIIGISAMPMLAQQTADDFIKEAQEALKVKNYKEASTALQFAMLEVNKLMSSDIQSKLPQEINGFKLTANDNSGGAGAMAGMGGGSVISGEYHKPGAENAEYAEGESENYFEISIIANSPLVSSLSMMLSNPMFMAASPGSKVVKAGTKKGILKKESDDEYSFQVPYGSSLMTLKGYSFKTEAEFVAIVNAVNFDELAKAAGE
ncbi:MAG TPA: hypothetical protein DCQ31_09560 [Bacteroidales bacterium]|nr:hypothetical protein [Bacteroidales bacterium]